VKQSLNPSQIIRYDCGKEIITIDKNILDLVHCREREKEEKLTCKHTPIHMQLVIGYIDLE
jgi:hypothetical protein